MVNSNPKCTAHLCLPNRELISLQVIGFSLVRCYIIHKGPSGESWIAGKRYIKIWRAWFFLVAEFEIHVCKNVLRVPGQLSFFVSQNILACQVDFLPHLHKRHFGKALLWLCLGFSFGEGDGERMPLSVFLSKFMQNFHMFFLRQCFSGSCSGISISRIDSKSLTNLRQSWAQARFYQQVQFLGLCIMQRQ